MDLSMIPGTFLQAIKGDIRQLITQKANSSQYTFVGRLVVREEPEGDDAIYEVVFNMRPPYGMEIDEEQRVLKRKRPKKKMAAPKK